MLGRKLILLVIILILVVSGSSFGNGEQIETRSIMLSVSSSSVLVTNVIPEDYEGTTHSWELEAINGKVILNLTSDPLFMEELSEENGASPLQPDVTSLPYDSPFGFHPAWTSFKNTDTWQDRYTEALNMGIQWERCMIYAFWPEVQRDKNEIEQGIFHWETYDLEYGLLAQAGINILANIAHIWANPNPSYAENSSSWLPYDEEAYVKFVKAVVKRYATGTTGNITIKYWQVENEPNFIPERSVKSYAQLMKLTYEAIKEADPEAKVLIGGCGGPGWDLSSRTIGWYEEVLRELDGKYMDIFDWHFYGNATGDYKRLEYVIPAVRDLLDRYGFGDVPIWITEMGTYSGTLNDGGRGGKIPDPGTFQSEEAQARDMVKRYVYSLSLGVEKVFMCFGLVEGFQEPDNDYFDHTGFICDGRFNDDRGAGAKKKAYYAYKVMISKLEGSDWSSIEPIDLGEEDVYAFKFSRNGKTVYIIWWDNYEDEMALVQERIRQFNEEQKQRGLITVGTALAILTAFAAGAYWIIRKGFLKKSKRTFSLIYPSSEKLGNIR